MCLLPSRFPARGRRDTDDAVVGVLALWHVGGELKVLTFELSSAGLDEIEISVEIHVDVAAEELRSYV